VKTIFPAGAPALGSLPDGTPLATYQHAMTNYYDAAGVVTTNVNANLEQTITYFDALKRPSRLEIRDASNNLVHEKSFSYSPDHDFVGELPPNFTAASPLLRNTVR